jgi:DNA-binding transcriptional LysR family regulator
LTPALEVEGQPLALELVRRGVGHMILPHCAIAAEMAAGRVRGAPIRGASLTWALGCNATRAKAPAVTALVDLLTELSAIRFAAKPQAPANRAAGASRSAKTAKARRRRSLRP